jgi:glycosyltransferase involved in cell wall biosynthesis
MHQLVIAHNDALTGAGPMLAAWLCRFGFDFVSLGRSAVENAGDRHRVVAGAESERRLVRVAAWKHALADTPSQSLLVLWDGAQSAADILLAAHALGRRAHVLVLAPPRCSPLNRALLLKASRVAVMDDAQVQQVAGLFGFKSQAPRWLPPFALPDAPPADDKRLTHFKRRIAFRKADRLLVSYGPFRTGSGHEGLIEAVARLHKQIDGVKLVCIGEGPRAVFLQNLAAALDIAGRVYFLPPDADADAALALAELAVCPHESGSWSPWRALAADRGLALVRSRCDLTGDTFQDDADGWAIPPASIDALHAALLDAFSDESQRQARAAAAQAGHRAMALSPEIWLARLLA